MRDTACILGVQIDRLDMGQTVERCIELISRRRSAQHVCVNVAKLVAVQRDERLAEIIRNCAIVSADGQAVVWASRLLDDPLPSRVAGIDLMHQLLREAEARGFRVFILGARPDSLRVAVERLREQYPQLVISGWHHGFFAEDENASVCENIRHAQPDILLVAISSPRKEYWLAEHLGVLDVPFAMGVGGAIDVIAGVRKRAPKSLQRVGLEWLFRLVQEPRRLLWRYLETNTVFLLLVGLHVVRRAGGPARR